ncbi:MAG: YncE family protein [Pseudomonadota bacterium]|nr:YncE family protein [Pseudomonadota bacterium]
MLSGAVKGALARVYVPNLDSNDVSVIDPATLKVVDRFPVGRGPQHVVPSFDLKTLWVTGSAQGKVQGSLTPIDPTTGKPGPVRRVEDAYNMYFTPDGASALVVAESRKRLDYRAPATMTLQGQLPVPNCSGINHADFAPDGSYAIFTCEFAGSLAKIDVKNRKVLGYLRLTKGGMPQDVRIGPDGRTFYVANMMTDGVSVVDGPTFRELGFVRTGTGAHGIYPSRDGRELYVANRGSHRVGGAPHGPGSVSVINFASGKVKKTWPIPNGGSPDMGNVSLDGRTLWLSGRFDDEVYAIDTRTGGVKKIKVGRTPHGLTVWPQPGSYSLGHTGIMR